MKLIGCMLKKNGCRREGWIDDEEGTLRDENEDCHSSQDDTQDLEETDMTAQRREHVSPSLVASVEQCTSRNEQLEGGYGTGRLGTERSKIKMTYKEG